MDKKINGIGENGKLVPSCPISLRFLSHLQPILQVPRKYFWVFPRILTIPHFPKFAPNFPPFLPIYPRFRPILPSLPRFYHFSFFPCPFGPSANSAAASADACVCVCVCVGGCGCGCGCVCVCVCVFLGAVRCLACLPHEVWFANE